jgi:hypothetical protein
VLEYAVLRRNVRYSGHSSLYVKGKELGPVPCLAISQPVDGTEILLMHCDRAWNIIGVSEYNSVPEAEQRAEQIYSGISACWVKSDLNEAEARKFLQEQNRELKCSFCGRGPNEVNQLVNKGSVRICNLCIVELYQMISEN